MMTLAPKEKRVAVSDAIEAAGGNIIPFEIDGQGLVVNES